MESVLPKLTIVNNGTDNELVYDIIEQNNDNKQKQQKQRKNISIIIFINRRYLEYQEYLRSIITVIFCGLSELVYNLHFFDTYFKHQILMKTGEMLYLDIYI
jgi:hypothetical protein